MLRPAVLTLALLMASAAHAATDPARLSETVRVLASDEFEGRAPGSAGEVKTLDYLTARFKALGLEPGGPKGSYLQAVPLLKTQVDPKGTFSLTTGDGSTPLVLGTDIAGISLLPVDKVSIENAPWCLWAMGSRRPSGAGMTSRAWT